MIGRCMYVWRLAPVLAAEGGTAKVIEKAVRAHLSALWIKVAEGDAPHSNVTGAMEAKFTDLAQRAQAKGVEIWGWHVPRCADQAAARAEAKVVGDLAQKLALNGVIMDAESESSFFLGGVPEATKYSSDLRNRLAQQNKRLALSSHDVPQNFPDFLPKFNAFAANSDLNFPQVYYGGSPSVAHRLNRAQKANAHVAIPFVPVGAGWIGDGGGCTSASACAERAREFIRLVKEREFQGYSFWHWGGAPLALWEVLNVLAP